MSREGNILLGKALDSLILSIEHFNRPWDTGRVEAVLILLDHSFEMLLKGAIIQRGGKIQKSKEKQTIGYDSCVNRALRDEKGGFITEEQAITLRTINSLRDAAQHYMLDISENHLYIHVQAGFTLFREITKKIFDIDIAEKMPERVLPVSTSPPLNLDSLFDNDMNEVKKLIKSEANQIEASAKLRALTILENSIRGDTLQPTESELNDLMTKIHEGTTWEELFPGVASISLVAEESNQKLSLRISKKEGLPVQLVSEGTPGAEKVAVKRVNELGFYSMGRDQLAEKVGLTGPKTTAVIWYLNLKKDKGCYKRIKIGKSKFDRYSPKAIGKIKEGIKETPINEIWEEYKRNRGKKKYNKEK